ncbi:hypothetical protein DFS34DRAFT_104897 [Phlyctochytrium arcticum]|nr:hypothetical protein DFS34DRAFT_104897 [Phlyctochytrium arcticum]
MGRSVCEFLWTMQIVWSTNLGRHLQGEPSSIDAQEIDCAGHRIYLPFYQENHIHTSSLICECPGCCRICSYGCQEFCCIITTPFRPPICSILVLYSRNNCFQCHFLRTVFRRNSNTTAFVSPTGISELSTRPGSTTGSGTGASSTR